MEYSKSQAWCKPLYSLIRASGSPRIIRIFVSRTAHSQQPTFRRIGACVIIEENFEEDYKADVNKDTDKIHEDEGELQEAGRTTLKG